MKTLVATQYSPSPAGTWKVNQPNMIGNSQSIIRLVDCARSSPPEVRAVESFCCTKAVTATTSASGRFCSNERAPRSRKRKSRSSGIACVM